MQYFLVEISYEAGNKVGGIWTVLTSKSRVMKAKFGDNYLAIGFYNPSQAAIEMIEEEPSGYILNAIKDMQLPGIKFHYGSWA
ncbi:MAG: glycogen synthase, partial [Nanoarchaeota archaeon]|nr:glycogen synthase [Nanoarchaeota archaeon]